MCNLSHLKNVCVSDVTTGNILFERIYNWSDGAALSNLGALIQVFYQFAREVDDGGMISAQTRTNRFVTVRRLSQLFRA